MPRYTGAGVDVATFEPFVRRSKQRNPHYPPLSEAFDEFQLSDKFALAEHRIVGAFAEASDIRRGRSYATPGYIGDIGSRQKDLVQYVTECHATTRRHGFVTVSELPRGLRGNYVRAAKHYERQLVAAKLAQLVQRKDIWYNAYATGIWEICQSLLDKYLCDQALARLAFKAEQQIRRELLHGNQRLRVVH